MSVKGGSETGDSMVSSAVSGGAESSVIGRIRGGEERMVGGEELCYGDNNE